MLAAFLGHMANDFNTSGALGALSKPLNEVNGLLAGGKGVDKGVKWTTLERFVTDMEKVATIFGCFDQEPAAWLARRRDTKAARIGLDTDRVAELVTARQTAREAKNWAEADRLREELAGLGVGVQDGSGGSAWDFS